MNSKVFYIRITLNFKKNKPKTRGTVNSTNKMPISRLILPLKKKHDSVNTTKFFDKHLLHRSS